MTEESYVYSDLPPGLSFDATGNIPLLYDAAAIDQALMTLFATISGERVRNPYGSNIISFLFRPMDGEVARELKLAIDKNVEKYEPRVNVEQIRVIPVYNYNYFNVDVSYRIIGLNGRYFTSVKLKSLSGDF